MNDTTQTDPTTALEGIAAARSALAHPARAGKLAEPFLRKLADHGRGVALIFARTETKMFHEQVWGRASAVLFMLGRVSFLTADGVKARANAGAPSCLVAYGSDDAELLRSSGIAGHFVDLRRASAAAA